MTESNLPVFTAQSLYNKFYSELQIENNKDNLIPLPLRINNTHEGYYLYKVNTRTKHHVNTAFITDANNLTKYPEHKNKKGLLVEADSHSLFGIDGILKIKLFINKSELESFYNSINNAKINANGFKNIILFSHKKILTNSYISKKTGKIVKECSTQIMSFDSIEKESN